MTPHHVDTPTAGHYKMRMVRNGPFVPVRIWFGPPHDPDTGEEMDRSHRWQAEIGGKEAAIERTWPWCAKNPIAEADYRYMRGVQQWATEHAPHEPEAAPREAVNINALKPLF
jgi:hypothetical protein